MSGEKQETTTATAAVVEERTRAIFLDFMTKIAQFEEQVDVGKRFLMRFHQELEYLRKPQLPKESGIVSEIIKSNCTDRMRLYLEAGSTLPHQNIRNISQLNSCGQNLEEHIRKAKILLDELQHLVDDAYGITLADNLRAVTLLDTCDDNDDSDSLMHESQPVENQELPLHELDNMVSFVSIMIPVHNMLKLDYTMQEKIVRSLSLKTPSSELESYCLMWDLRPYMDDNTMRLAWRLVP